MYGYMGKYAIVDLTKKEVKIKNLEETLIQEYIGGRGFIIRWLYDMLDKKTDPLSPENPLIFAVGPWTGTMAPSSGRWIVGGLAPQTGIHSIGIGGGQWGAHMKWAGFDAIIIKGKADGPVFLLVENNKIEIHPADKYWGMDNNQLESAIRSDLGNPDYHVAGIGPAGENLSHMATVIVDRTRSAGRGGMGAVMGSKLLKAIVAYGTQGVKVADPQGVIDLTIDLTARLMDEPHYKTYSYWGTTRFLERYTEHGGLMTRNAQKGIFDNWRKIDGNVYLDQFRIKQTACFACPIPCSSYYTVEGSEKLGPAIFGESVSASTLKEPGARCGVSDMGLVLRSHAAIDRYGLDLISAPATVAFAMEAYEYGVITDRDTGGVPLTWGNGHVVLEMLRRAAFGEGLGKVLMHGSRHCARTWGKGSERFLSDSKGLEPPATDARAYPSWALGYATSSRGACHMRAYSVVEFGGVNEVQAERMGVSMEVNERLGWKGKGRSVAVFEDLRSLGDCLTICSFVGRNELAFPENIVDLYTAVTGRTVTVKELYDVGERITNLERLINLRQGMKATDDDLPVRFLEEPLTEGASAGKVVPLEPMLIEYYQTRDWDRGDGKPSTERLKSLKLQNL